MTSIPAVDSVRLSTHILSKSQKIKIAILVLTSRCPWIDGKINHSNKISVFKLVKNEVLDNILGLFFQKLKIQDNQRQPSCFFTSV